MVEGGSLGLNKWWIYPGALSLEVTSQRLASGEGNSSAVTSLRLDKPRLDKGFEHNGNFP